MIYPILLLLFLTNIHGRFLLTNKYITITFKSTYAQGMLITTRIFNENYFFALVTLGLQVLFFFLKSSYSDVLLQSNISMISALDLRFHKCVQAISQNRSFYKFHYNQINFMGWDLARLVSAQLGSAPLISIRENSSTQSRLKNI